MLEGESQFLKVAGTDIDGTEDASDICIAVFENISIKNEKIVQIMIKPRTLKLQKAGLHSFGFALKNPKGHCNIVTSYQVCANSGMGCAIVDGDSLARFTALKNSPRNVISGIRNSL